jgi:hypothetical protein
MSFLKGNVTRAPQGNPYQDLGYTSNPFPKEGEVRADVFVHRPELDELQRDLQAFLAGRRKGTVWALHGEQGLGKSNFLQYLDAELQDLAATGDISQTAWRLLPSRALSPGRVAEEVVNAIGIERIRTLLEEEHSVPSNFRGTDFERFWTNASRQRPLLKEVAEIHAGFLVRWLGGHQVYKSDRDKYGILARERLPAAVAFPYLVGLVQMLDEAGLLERIILLLDEFEDVQSLKNAERTEYIQTLKALLNVFNWKGLYVILAGAPAAFEAIGVSYPSLATRWRVAELQPLRDTEAAVELANEYKARAMLQEGPTDELRPTTTEIQSIFIKLFNAAPGAITQRALLTALHKEVERLVEHLAGSSAEPPGGLGASRGSRRRLPGRGMAAR